MFGWIASKIFNIAGSLIYGYVYSKATNIAMDWIYDEVTKKYKPAKNFRPLKYR